VKTGVPLKKNGGKNLERIDKKGEKIMKRMNSE